MSANYVGVIERGEKAPSLEAFVNILNALNVSADLVLAELVNGSREAKASALSEKLAKLPGEDREKICAAVDAAIKDIQPRKLAAQSVGGGLFLQSPRLCRIRCCNFAARDV